MFIYIVPIVSWIIIRQQIGYQSTKLDYSFLIDFRLLVALKFNFLMNKVEILDSKYSTLIGYSDSNKMDE